MMKLNVLSSLALASVVFGISAMEATSVDAAVMNFDFTVDNLSGSLAGETFTGSFSFDDAGITGVGEETIDFASFSFDFQGESFDETDNIADGVVFFDGVFDGLDFDAGTDFSFEPEFGETFFAFDFGGDDVGTGDVTITPSTPNPEPESVPEPATVIGLLTTMAIATKIRASK